MRKVDLRIVTLEVPAQEAITRDNVTVKVNAVVYFQVVHPTDAVVKVVDYERTTSLIGQTMLRSILGQSDLDHLLSERAKINRELQLVIGEQTNGWGVKVTSVEVRDPKLPQSMQRAMARQAEAEREKRAKVIHAEGEYSASQELAAAAQVIGSQPATLQLRYLQTLTEIAAEKNSTIVFPLPLELLRGFLALPAARGGDAASSSEAGANGNVRIVRGAGGAGRGLKSARTGPGRVGSVGGAPGGRVARSAADPQQGHRRGGGRAEGRSTRGATAADGAVAGLSGHGPDHGGRAAARDGAGGQLGDGLGRRAHDPRRPAGAAPGRATSIAAKWAVGPYRREVRLQHPVDGARTNATCGNGVLVPVLPKRRPGAPDAGAEIRLEAVAATRGQRVGHSGHDLHPTTTLAHRRRMDEARRRAKHPHGRG
jgi:hypothetical protein